MTRADSVLDLLDRARESLLEAYAAPASSDRYLAAQLAALRAGGALVAGRRAGDQSGPQDIWFLTSSLAPDLGEWADYLALTTGDRREVQLGARRVTAREADDLLRSAETFLGLVRSRLGLPGEGEHLRLAASSGWS